MNHPARINDHTSSSQLTSKCKASLVQISSPAHISLQDTRWQELFLSYEILVHLDRDHSYGNLPSSIHSDENNSLVSQVARNMAKNTFLSSNLAGFTWHITRMINELMHSCISLNQSKHLSADLGDGHIVTPPTPANASLKIALVGKARVVCGAMNLYRIMVHEAIVKTTQKESNEHERSGQRHEDSSVADIFLFQSRQHSGIIASDENMAHGLSNALLTFLSSSEESEDMKELMYSTPELYDAIVYCLKLLLVLCSTQLYSQTMSSFQRVEEDNADVHCDFFLDIIMREASKRHSERNKKKDTNRPTWTPQGIIVACLNWIVHRPQPPERSITYHYKVLSDMIAREVKNEKPGLDGMFENYAIVMANAPSHIKINKEDDKGAEGGPSSPRNLSNASQYQRLIHLSSSLLLLPIRLLVIALRALGHSQSLLGNGKGSGNGSKLAELQALYGNRTGAGKASMPSPTNDVLWLSESPVADLGSSLFLLLANNHRAGVLIDEESDDYANNPFRVELASMDDNRWEGFTNAPANGGHLESTDIFQDIDLSNGVENEISSFRDSKHNNLLTINFEHLFDSFGGTLHSEVGALSLYTLLQASPIFAASLAVRSDLDKLVIPLLRTLYYSSSSTHHISGRTTTTSKDATSVTVLQQPFRSRSQLYVIMICLLIFSQDASFGPDSFKRSAIPTVLWYKERRLKNISLGSLLILSLLRSITFNLNRLQDPFLLSNCCAVLLNLSPHVADLNSYTAMRLVSVLIATLKRYTILVMKNGGKPAADGDVTSILGMYAEACRILLQVAKHAVRRKVVETNLHLVYALVYNQREFNTIIKSKCKLVLVHFRLCVL